MELMTVVVLGILVEAIVESGKNLFRDGKLSIPQVSALLVGILLAVSTGINLFGLLGIAMKYEIVGIVLSGIIIGRGSNYIFTIIDQIKNLGIKRF